MHFRKNTTGSNRKFTVIAHRADHVSAPENSLEAIDSAIQHEADFVELDLRTTSDSFLVIMHDRTIDRTTTGSGKVSDLMMNQIDTCHLRNSDQKVPLLEQCLKSCIGKINIYLDFKDADVAQTYSVILRYHAENNVLVYINEPEQYRAWRRIAPDIPLIISLPDTIRTPEQLEKFVGQYPAEVLDGDYTDYTPELIRKAKSLGIQAWPDIQGPDEMNNWEKAIEMGFTGLQSDHPEELIRWLKKRKLR